jgi:hypothetical protein
MDEKTKARDRETSRRRRLEGSAAEADLRYIAKRPPARQRNVTAWNRSGRHHAHKLMRKYGMTLGQAEKMGVIPPDVQEALSGDLQA